MIVKHCQVTIQAPEGFEVDGDDPLAQRIFKLMGFPAKAPPGGACSVEVKVERTPGRTVAGRYYQSVH